MPNTNRPTITTHVLDTSRGEPAAGVAVSLWRLEGTQHTSPQGTGETDRDGRIADLLDGPLVAGVYRLTFDVGAYFRSRQLDTFFGSITLEVRLKDGHQHIPLLVSRYGIVSYLGS